GPVRHGVLCELADKGHVVNDLLRDPAADVANDHRVAQPEVEEVSGINPRIEAGEHKQAQVGEDHRALLAAGCREGAVSLEGGIDPGHAASPAAASGPVSLSPERWCRRRRGFGAHQFHSPSSSISEGTSSARIRLASIRTARAVPTPFSLMKMICEVAKAPIAIANSSAAAVTIRPVRSRPTATASELGVPESWASLIRESRKTP